MVDAMTEDYSLNSLPQQMTIQTIQSHILKEFTKYVQQNTNAIKQRKIIQIADLGCADGRNDTLLLKELIKIIRSEISQNFQINIYMNDLPSTDASRIISNVTSEIHDENVFFYAVPKSFYEKLFPDDFIDVFLCMTTIHWLDKKHPAPYVEFVEDYSLHSFATQEANEVDYIKRKIYQNQEINLQEFLNQRVRELTKNGLIFIGNLIPMTFKNVENVKIQDFYHMIRRCLKQLLEDNYIPASTINKMNLNIAARTSKEFLLAIKNDKNLSEKFEILQLKEIEMEDPISHQFKQNKIDTEQYAEIYANQIKAPTYNAYKGILIENDVSEEQATELMDTYYNNVKELIVQNYDKMPSHLTALICILQHKDHKAKVD